MTSRMDKNGWLNWEKVQPLKLENHLIIVLIPSLGVQVIKWNEGDKQWYSASADRHSVDSFEGAWWKGINQPERIENGLS
jgi:hypothetical protein